MHEKSTTTEDVYIQIRDRLTVMESCLKQATRLDSVPGMMHRHTQLLQEAEMNKQSILAYARQLQAMADASPCKPEPELSWPPIQFADPEQTTSQEVAFRLSVRVERIGK
jgi:hypothetical protein